MTRAILLPGTNGTSELLSEFAAALAPDFDVTIVTYPVDVELGYSELTALVRNRLPQGEPFVMIAESFSGPIAITLAAERPPGLERLVLCMSFAKAPRPQLEALARILRALPLQWLPIRLAMPALMGRWSSASWRDRIRRSLRGVKPAVIARRLQEACIVDVSMALPRIDCPLLYLKASHDMLVPTASWHVVHDASRNATRTDIEGPHFLLQARPTECAAAIRAAGVPLIDSTPP